MKSLRYSEFSSPTYKNTFIKFNKFQFASLIANEKKVPITIFISICFFFAHLHEMSATNEREAKALASDMLDFYTKGHLTDVEFIFRDDGDQVG